MATYKYPQFITQLNHTAFDTITHPGSDVPYSGIYRCEGCAKEIVSTHGNTMPPQNHHQHNAAQGAIRWRLIVTHT